MVVNNYKNYFLIRRYLVNCDICKKSFHGHCAELTLEDMQRILQDGEKFVCDNCPIDGASAATVSTTDTQKEEDTLNAGTTNGQPCFLF